MIFDYIKYKNWSKRNIVVAACVPIAMVAIYNWFVSPQVQYLMAAQEYENSAVRTEKANKRINAGLKISRENLSKVSQQFQQKKQEFFGVEDSRNFFDSIQSNTEKNKCFVDTLEFLPAKQIAVSDGNSVDIRQYQVNLTVSGQYPNILKLLDSLQNRKQKVWIDAINLHLKDQMSDLLVCDLSLSIYTLKVKEIESDVKTEK